MPEAAHPSITLDLAQILVSDLPFVMVADPTVINGWCLTQGGARVSATTPDRAGLSEAVNETRMWLEFVRRGDVFAPPVAPPAAPPPVVTAPPSPPVLPKPPTPPVQPTPISTTIPASSDKDTVTDRDRR